MSAKENSSEKSKRFTLEFKKQIVDLVNNGKSVTAIVDEYSISRTAVYQWVQAYNKTKSFKAKDNRSDEENELLGMRKELKQLRMENDILKQAALIMGRK